MRWIVALFVVSYGFALVALALGVTGWLGAARDPLSAIFLLPLGLPWNILLDRAGLAGIAALIAAPAANLTLLLLLWRWLRRVKT